MELQGSESNGRDAQVILSSRAQSRDPLQTLSVTSRDPSTPLRSAQDDVEPLKPAEPRIGKIVAWAVGRPARRIDFTVWFYRNGASPGATATLSQIADEFLTSVELRACWLIPIEIAYQTNAERDIVEIIAVHVAAIDLTPPAIPNFDLPISG